MAMWRPASMASHSGRRLKSSAGPTSTQASCSSTSASPTRPWRTPRQAKPPSARPQRAPLRTFRETATFLSQGSLMDASQNTLAEKFAPIHKGLLEFAMLRVIAGEKLYVAGMLQRLANTEFATQEGTLYPLLSRLRREGLVDYEWQESDAGPPHKYYRLTDIEL